MNTGILKAEGLCKSYGSKRVLEGLDLSVHAGQKVVLTGFNGVGKSTLLNTLAGRLPPLAGRFRFSEQAALGYFPQALAWTDGTRTPEELVTGAFPTLDRQEARRALARCGVRQEHAIQAVATLSGGEQARVKLCLLTLRPCNFLLLDEPTKGMDSYFKEKLAQILKKLKAQGITVVMVSHDVEFCAQYGDLVSMFFDGQILTTATPRRFFGRNSFYTTAANRMSRCVFRDAITAGDVVELYRVNGGGDRNEA